MSLHVGTGKAREVNSLLEAFTVGRHDPAFFCYFFLGRTLHPGQIKFIENAQAKINCLATANRWGKTTELCGMHYHAGVYKLGAEEKYTQDGQIQVDAFTALKYETVHTAGVWEQTSYVWEDALKLQAENPRISALIAEAPRSLPPHIKGINGWKWMFRTLGADASGVDGKSIYLLTIDEAGWIENLEEMMKNVLRVRVADVRGRIVIVGTFKPGISRDFYKICTRSAAYTGTAIGFAHQSDEDGDGPQNLDSAIAKYLKEYGIDISEYKDALERGYNGH